MKKNGIDLEEKLKLAADAIEANIRRHNRMRRAIRKDYKADPKQITDMQEEQEEQEKEENNP
jgi:hypothetical protein